MISRVLNLLDSIAREGLRLPPECTRSDVELYEKKLAERCRHVLDDIRASHPRPEGPDKIRSFVIDFPLGVEVPEGFDHTLAGLVSIICGIYEHDNPTRVMWPAGQGFRPKWSKADAAFLGTTADHDAPDTGEPSFDRQVYHISVSERRADDKTLRRRGIDPSTVKQDWEE